MASQAQAQSVSAGKEHTFTPTYPINTNKRIDRLGRIFFYTRKIMSDLHTSNYRGHKERNPTALQGTCEWIISNHQYHPWLSETVSTLLWISADAGWGKSVLTSFLIDRHEKISAQHSNICYFLKTDSGMQRDATSVVFASIHQLYRSRSKLIKAAQISCGSQAKS